MADIQYPTFRYHATEEPRIVNSADEDKALGKGWHDAPVRADEDSADESAEPAPKAKGKGKK